MRWREGKGVGDGRCVCACDLADRSEAINQSINISLYIQASKYQE